MPHGCSRFGARLGALVFAALCLATLAPVALAAKPERVTVPIGTDVTDPAGAVCPFAVRTKLIGGNQTMWLFESGRVILAGTHIDEITNLENGKSVVLSLHGPISITSSSIRAVGRVAFAFFPGDAGPGDTSIGRLYVFTGAVRIETDEFGVFTDFSSIGRMEDVCAMID